MPEFIIAIDVDGVLKSYGTEQLNEMIRSLVVALSHFRNVKVVVWSARGREYAHSVVKEYGIESYIREVYTKGDIEPDIAIDDQLDFGLGRFNLIYNENQPPKYEW